MDDKKCIHYGDCDYTHMDCEETSRWFKCPDRDTEKPTPFGLLERLVRWLKRGMEYCFIRRLAIHPYDTYHENQEGKDLMLLEWQKMPKGYRWF